MDRKPQKWDGSAKGAYSSSKEPSSLEHLIFLLSEYRFWVIILLLGSLSIHQTYKLHTKSIEHSVSIRDREEQIEESNRHLVDIHHQMRTIAEALEIENASSSEITMLIESVYRRIDEIKGEKKALGEKVNEQQEALKKLGDEIKKAKENLAHLDELNKKSNIKQLILSRLNEKERIRISKMDDELLVEKDLKGILDELAAEGLIEIDGKYCKIPQEKSELDSPVKSMKAEESVIP